MITSVETVSEGQISEPTTAQYRTVPLRPYNVTFDPLSIGIVLIMIIMLQLSWFTILIIIVFILIYNKGPTTFLCAGGVQLMCQSLTDTRLLKNWMRMVIVVIVMMMMVIVMMMMVIVMRIVMMIVMALVSSLILQDDDELIPIIMTT